MKAFFLFFTAIFLSLLFFGCSPDTVYEESFPVMSTVCEIKIISPDREKSASVARDVKELLKKIEAKLNFYDPKSRISTINSKAPYGFIALTDDEQVLIHRSVQMSVLTEGAFDITFFPVWKVWKQAEKKGCLPTDKELSKALKSTGYKKLVFSNDGKSMKFASKKISINLGGIAKEYALVECADLLKSKGMDNALISLGGDIVALGRGNGNGWKIGIQDPFDPAHIVETVTASNKLVLTSGVYQRYVDIAGKKYHHMIDARTGWPVKGLSSVTLIKDLSSGPQISSLAVFLMGKDKAVEYLDEQSGLGYCVITSDRTKIKNF